MDKPLMLLLDLGVIIVFVIGYAAWLSLRKTGTLQAGMWGSSPQPWTALACTLGIIEAPFVLGIGIANDRTLAVLLILVAPILLVLSYTGRKGSVFLLALLALLNAVLLVAAWIKLPAVAPIDLPGDLFLTLFPLLSVLFALAALRGASKGLNHRP
jgi:hypothetical protein